MRIKAGLILLFFIVTFDAHAIEDYIDINYLSTKTTFGSLKAHPSSYQISYGIKIKQYLGLEVYYGGSISDDNFTSTFSTKVKELSGYNFIGHYPMNSNVSIFAKLGHGAITHESHTGSEADDTGFTVGFGVNIKMNSIISVNIEYLQLPDVETSTNNVETNAFVIGLRSTFNDK